MRRRRVWLFGIAAIPLLLIGAFFAWIKSVEARRWADHERTTAELIAEVKGRDPRRPVLRGDPVPGNAWTDYERALSVLKGAFSVTELSDFIERTSKADRAKAEALIAAHEPLLDFLRAGARRAEGAEPLAAEKGIGAGIPRMGSSLNLTHLAVGRARLLAESGKNEAAFDLLLDAAQFAADMGRQKVLIGEVLSLNTLETVMREWEELAPRSNLSPEAWKRLERALGALDTGFFDHAESVLNDVTCFAASTVLPDWVSGEWGEAMEAWRYGFSYRIMTADAVETHLRRQRILAEAARLPWAEAGRRRAEVQEEEARETNPLLRGPMIHGGQSFRTTLARLRLLRSAAAFRASGVVEPLADPFGTTLKSLSTPNGIKVWSVGADGVDHHGAGSDLVIEVLGK